MKFLPFLLSVIVCTSCVTTSHFNNRKYTKGRFKINRDYKIQKGDEQASKDEKQFQEFGKDSTIHLTIKVQEMPKSASKTYVRLDQKVALKETIDTKPQSKWAKNRLIEKPIPTDSTEVSLSDDNMSTALENEKKAETAFILSIAGIVGLLLFFPLGIALFIIAIVMANNVQDSVYNTVDGLRFAKNAKSIAWISLIVFLALLLIAIGFLFLLLLAIV